MANDFDTRASPSTTDISEDSVDIKVKPVTLSSSVAMTAASNRTRNKRKSSEPRKLKEIINPVIESSSVQRWTSSDDIVEVVINTEDDHDELIINNVKLPINNRDIKKRTRRSAVTAAGETWSQKKQRKLVNSTNNKCSNQVKSKRKSSEIQRHLSMLPGENSPSLACLGLPFDVRNILGPTASTLLGSSPSAIERLKTAGVQVTKDDSIVESTSAGLDYDVEDEDVQDAESESAASGSNNRHKQRNYKNMTRERRIEANARERTRVHTISAAFDNLRRAVPSYSCHQKLSKLAILRIACSYILALASLNDQDYSSQQDCPSFAECVDLCTRTIQAEGKARKRKD